MAVTRLRGYHGYSSTAGGNIATIFKQFPGENVNDWMNGGQEQLVTSLTLFGERLATCSFCGKPEASGWWHGHDCEVMVCRACAVEVLPRLAADALVSEYGHFPNAVSCLRRWLVEMERAFWEAAAIAISRCVEADKRLRQRDGDRQTPRPPPPGRNGQVKSK